MSPRPLSCPANGFGRGIGIEAGDVLSDGAVEQLDSLRQITDLSPDLGSVPHANVRSIDPNGARFRLPQAQTKMGKGGFASCTGPEDRHDLPRLDSETDVFQDRYLHFGRCSRKLSYFDHAARIG